METPPSPPAASAGPANITPALAEVLESGLIMYVASRSAGNKPSSVGAAGLRVETPTLVTVFLAEAVIGAVMPDLLDNGQLSVELVKVTDARAIQIKGQLLDHGPATAADQAFQETYRARLLPELTQVGMPRSTVARLVLTPSRALRLSVTALFLQTPGPGAGRPLEAGAGSLLRAREGARAGGQS
jgi:hypothetical protein